MVGMEGVCKMEIENENTGGSGGRCLDLEYSNVLEHKIWEEMTPEHEVCF